VGSAVFKTDVGREERPGCVRFARASAMRIHLRKRSELRSGTTRRRSALSVSRLAQAGTYWATAHDTMDGEAQVTDVLEPSGDTSHAAPRSGRRPSSGSLADGRKRRLRRLLLWGAVAVAFLAVLAASLVLTERSAFCKSCHEMDPYYSAWRASGHAEEAQCVECHVDPGLVAHLAHKPTALKEVWDHFTKDNRFPNYSVEVPDSRCVPCHPKVDKKIGTRFSHLLHQKNGRCQECHATVGHEVSIASLREAGILKEGAGMPPAPTGVSPSAVPGHKKVVCQQCHDQVKMKCSLCHQASHDPLGECSNCHAVGNKFVFVHPVSNADCGSCHKKSAKHKATTAACTTCHAVGGKTWAFTHPADKKCTSCHKAPAKHYGTGCATCHSPKIPFAKARFNHPGNTGEHSYRSFACVKCHPRSYSTASCTCHGGRAPSGD
jgi:nitrate/TMAO reductase-like tetraheme cytochrome c subunit